ncbi:hypothetical protein GCM10027597_46980 [Saccharopolyspora tripterygii]
MVAAAPHARDRGEQDERVEVVGQQRVEVLRAVDLGAQHLGEDLGRGVVDRVQPDGGGRVQDRAHLMPVGAEPGEQCGDRVAVGDVAGHDGGRGAEFAQFAGEFGGAGRVLAAAAGEHQVLGAQVGQPTGDVRPERAGASGDDRGAARCPRFGAVGARRGVHDAAGEHTVDAHGELVLVTGLDQQGREPASAALVELLGDVDRTAPALRVLQRGGPAEPHRHRLRRVLDGVRPAGGHGVARDVPQRSVDARVAERLDERDGEHEADRQVHAGLGGVLGTGQQRHHSGEIVGAG